MIKSFRCDETGKIFREQHSRKLPGTIQEKALQKLQMLHAAVELRDLLRPPGNKLEALKGDRRGEHSIRINRQWRICFKWEQGNAYEVRIEDYH